MKRSGNVGLVLMGGAAFAATFAAGMAYFAWQKPSHAAQPQAAAAAAAAAQSCTARPDGTQNCQPARRSFAYYLFPSFSNGSSASAASAPDPKVRTQSAALTSNARAYAPAVDSSSTTRGGFGTTAQSGSYRTASAGG
ncbi:MAG: hypothetical protein QOH67_911 [Hyphomicrobiales bacterium]|jgi:hypothetical protein|nr:hypothetical protein [Hyphomicrobiales bacterium]